MRLVEKIINLVLVVAFIYALLFFVFLFLGIEVRLPVTSNFSATILALAFISIFLSRVFPLWNVSVYIKSDSIPDLITFRNNYRKKFYYLFMGFSGLLLWTMSAEIISFTWFAGLIFILVSIIFMIKPK